MKTAKQMTINEFNNLNFISPASGDVWNFSYAISKLLDRSKIQSDAFLKKKAQKNGRYGDRDYTLYLCYTTTSQWTDSPDVGLFVNIPAHMRVSGGVFFNHNVDYCSANLSEFRGILTINDIDIKFALSELDKDDLQVVKDVFSIAEDKIKSLLFKSYLDGDIKGVTE